MNALLKKEIRLLLTNFVIGVALILVCFLLPRGLEGSVWKGVDVVLPFWVCPAMAILLALSSFGGEVSTGMFAGLLTQPVSRQKIWDTKIALLALSLLVLGLLWCGTSAKWINAHPSWMDLLTPVFLFLPVIFTGGLWTVLLLRQVVGAFWFTILVPVGLIAILGELLGDGSYEWVTGVMALALGIYSLAGFFFARWLFFRAQDVQWSGGVIVMPELGRLTWFKTGAATRRGWRPRWALLGKELKLHQAQFVIAGLLLVLHLGVVLTRTLGHFARNSTTEYLLEVFWVLWLVMPLLVGAAAVAEERRLGTLEGQLCLPVRRRTQLAIKMLTVLGLSLLFGVGLPCLFEGSRILPDWHFSFSVPDDWHPSAAEMGVAWVIQTVQVHFPLLALAAGVWSAGLIAFHASTLGRNTLQTLAPAVAGIMCGVAPIMLFLVVSRLYAPSYPWQGMLWLLVIPPMLLLALWRLALANFQTVKVTAKTVVNNLLALTATLLLGGVITSALYHRVWEKLTPVEPSHGPAQLSLSHAPEMRCFLGGSLTVRMPGGKILNTSLTGNGGEFDLISYCLNHFSVTMSPGQWVNRSNWLSVSLAGKGLVGIKADGTLWLSEDPVDRKRRFANYDSAIPFVQFGHETNWTSAACLRLTTALLVKNDGTLWLWGAEPFNYQKKSWPGLQAFTPRRLGTESNWAGISQTFDTSSDFILQKTDGSTWGSWIWPTNGLHLLEVETNFWVRNLETFRGVARIGYGFKIGIRDDGTFRILSRQRYHSGKNSYSEWENLDLPIGTGTNWLALGGSWNGLVLLKNDGTLWEWHVPFYCYWNQEMSETEAAQELQKVQPVRLGNHSDWVAITSFGQNLVSLAADGSLWYWPLGVTPDDYGLRENPDFEAAAESFT